MSALKSQLQSKVGRWGKYNALDTKELLEAADRFLMDGDEARFSLVALDSETNGLDLYKSVVIGFSFAVSATQGFYAPMLYWCPDQNSLKTKKIKGVVHKVYERGCLKCWWTGKTYPEFVTPKEYQPPEFIKKYLKRWFSKVMILAHNAPFDINQIWANFGIDLSENLFLDTALLAHIVNENTPNALKEVATEFKEELGFDPWVDANSEQKELGASIIQNGGTYNARTKHVWRAGKEPLDKYGCSDTFLTYGIFEVLMQKFLEEYGEEKLPWLLEHEVMPLCREVVIPMKRRGVYIDVPYFKELREQTARVMLELEDRFLSEIPAGHLGKFSKGKSIEEEVSQGKMIKKIIELEGLKIPTKLDKKTGKYKETMAEKELRKAYQENPHWLWGYILGEDELRYSDEKLAKLRAQLYYESTGRRYRFNLGSDAHLRWLFCDRLGMDPKSLPQTDSATKDNPIPSMAAEVLEERMLPLFPWVRSLMLYKKLSKLQGTYIAPAIELNQDGWLFMDMKQNGTISGRFSCSGGFNLQTLPKVEELDKCGKCGSKEITVKHQMPLLATMTCAKCHHVEKDILCPSAIKRGFIAPPGYKIVNADYSSLEPRVFSYMSGDKKLKQVYWDNLDLYSKVYCDMMREDYEDLKKVGRKAERDLFKPVCFVAGTKVQTDSGFKNIEELQIGEFVQTESGFRQVSNITRRDADSLLQLTTNRQTVICTPDHKIWDVGKNDWKEARSFAIGDFTQFLPEPISGKIQILPIFSNGSFKNGASKPLSFLTFDTNWAWILGAFLGDGIGCYTRREAAKKRGLNSHLISIYVGICGLEQDVVVEEFRRRFEEMGLGLTKRSEKSVSGGNFVTYNIHDFEIGKIFQNTFAAIHSENGKGGKNLRVQNFVINSPIDVKLAFLAGLLDTDGYLKKKSNGITSDLAFCSKSAEFASDVGMLLSDLGVSYSLNPSYNKTYKRNYFIISVHQSGVFRLRELGLDKFLVCPRKKEAVSAKICLAKSSNQIKPGKVTDIVVLPGREVFDITVDGVPEFVANNMRVHNCLAIPYGARNSQVANLMGLKKRIKFLNKESGRVESKEVLDVEKGAYYRDLYLSTYPDLAKYMERQELACITEGKTSTLVGRIRHFEHAPKIYKQLEKAGVSIEDFLDARYNELKKTTVKVGDGILKRSQFEKLCKRFGFKVEDAIESGGWAYLRELFKKDYNGSKNTPIQGMAGHICNMGMRDTNRNYRAAGIDGWVALQIHDEIMSYVRADQAEAAVPLMKRGMEESMYAKLIDIPMIADPLIADNMRDAK